MRFLTIAAAPLILLAGCSGQPDRDAAATNADAVADQLESRADNLEMMADDTTNSDAAMSMENTADTLDEAAANTRAAANPHDRMK